MPRIEKLFAFVVSDRNQDDEGVVGALGNNHQWMPLVGADMDRIESLVPIAKEVANGLHKEITVLEFSVRRVVQVIHPDREAMQ